MQQNYDYRRRGLTLDEAKGSTDEALSTGHHEPHVLETEIEAGGWAVADVLHGGRRASILHGGAYHGTVQIIRAQVQKQLPK